MAKDKEKSPDVEKTPDASKKESKKEGKTFSQEAVNELMGATRKEVRETLSKEFEEKLKTELEKAQQEAERLAKLSAEEREKEITERNKKEVQERERNIAIRENTLEVKSLFLEKGYKSELAELAVTEDKEESLANAQKILEAIDESVQKGVEDRLKDKPPKSVKSTSKGSQGMKPWY